jgi:hypothetical protein
MQKVFEIIQQTRKNFLQLTEGLTIEQLNKIPNGFNNNIIWNYAHIISAQQTLCYKLSGLPFVADEKLVDIFKKGTKPESFVDEHQLSHIKRLSLATIEKLQIDFADNLFVNYQTYTTSFNLTLTNIEDAIRFVEIHDAQHYGYAMAQRRLVV